MSTPREAQFPDGAVVQQDVSKLPRVRYRVALKPEQVELVIVL